MEPARSVPPYPLMFYSGGHHIHAVHFIYIRAPQVSDATVLDWLEIRGAENEPGPWPDMTFPCLWITRCAGWIHVADDLTFTLFHRRNRLAVLERLAKHAEVFMTMAGDCDESYEFVHFVDGERVRHREVSSPRFRDRKLERDEGTPLPSESPEVYQLSAVDLCFELAASLGIDVDHRGKKLAKYSLENATLVGEGA